MDSVGLLELPTRSAPNGGGAALVDKPQAIGDPALVILADYLATVLNTDCQPAWEALVPTAHRGILRGPKEVGGVGRGTVVREVHFMNPVPLNPTGINTRFINDANLPALYVYRDFRSGRKEQYTSDVNRRTSTIKVEWIAPYTGDQIDIITRASFHNAIASAVERAIRFGRHRSWLVGDDGSSPKSIATTTTQTSAWAIDGVLLNGPDASTTIFPARSILITTTPQNVATFSTTPIRVFGVNANHRPWADTVTLGNVLGGEGAYSVWRFERATRIEFPGMPVAGASIHVGYHASPDQREGSLVARHAGFSRMQIIQPGDLRPVPTGQTGAGKDDSAMGVAIGLEISIQVEEDLNIDPLQHAALFDSLNSVESRIVRNGETWSIDYFKLPETIQI